jgi:hypothetical protein
MPEMEDEPVSIVSSVDEAKAEKDCCAICLHSDDEQWKLSCTHEFHARCIKTWFKKETTCPMCRTEIPQNEQRMITIKLTKKEEQELLFQTAVENNCVLYLNEFLQVPNLKIDFKRALERAILNHYIQIIKILMKYHKVDQKILSYAIQNRVSVSVIQVLCTALDTIEYEPVDEAIERNSVELITFLVENHLDRMTCPARGGVLSWCLDSKKYDLVKKILPYDVFDTKYQSDGVEVLMSLRQSIRRLVQRGDLDIIKLILENANYAKHLEIQEYPREYVINYCNDYNNKVLFQLVHYAETEAQAQSQNQNP